MILLLNGVQEVGGLSEGTSLRRRDPLDPTKIWGLQ